MNTLFRKGKAKYQRLALAGNIVPRQDSRPTLYVGNSYCHHDLLLKSVP